MLLWYLWYFQYYSNSIIMDSFSNQGPSTPAFPIGTSYSPDFDSSPFMCSPLVELPLSEIPFERLYGRAKQYIDITANTTVTSGTTFIPSSSSIELGSSEQVSNWTKQDEADFEEYLRTNKPRFILTAKQRMAYYHHLQNPNIATRSEGTNQQDNRNMKATTLRFYELQDSQIYWKAEFDKTTNK